MKNLLTILFLAFAFAASAQTYTVVSTTTNRTLAITPLAVQIVSSNTAAGVRTLLNVTNATGLEATAANLTTVSNTVTTQGNTLATNAALLNGTNTFTGTNTFNTNTILGTNVANTLFGIGGRWRLIYSSGSNYFTGTAVTLETNVFASSVTIPPLLSANSTLLMGYITHRTNNTTQALWNIEVRNGTTNGATLGGVSIAGGATAYQSVSPQPTSFLLANCGAFNYQWVQGTNYATTAPGYNPGLNTTVSNTVSLVLWHSSAVNCSPLTVERFMIWEIY